MNRFSAGSRRHRNGQNQVRIIGGKWRGRKLSFPDIPGLRPTGDRIRETLFNWLAPALPGARCLDLFAGSGALGIEAISRGASEVILVEKHPRAANAISESLSSLDIAGAQLCQRDALEWLARRAERPFDIVFLDPPFADKLLEPCISLLNSNGYLNPSSLVYLETDKAYSVAVPENWRWSKEKSAGQVCFRLFQII